MCGVCGCGEGDRRIEGMSGPARVHVHTHADGTTHAHTHDDDTSYAHPHTHDDGTAHAHPHTHADGTTHPHSHASGNEHAHGHGHEHTHAPVGEHTHTHSHSASASVSISTRSRLVTVERDLLARNDAVAARNRLDFHATSTLVLNLLSSPGSGKTALLVETLKRMAGRVSVAVIEGDQETSADADRIRATGAPAIQINTGKGCHLDAEMVRDAKARIGAPMDGILFIENVGNLVCPAAFDLGETHRVVLVSTTEGEDKPLKYPGIFTGAALMVVTKCDLLPHLDLDVDRLIANARRIAPTIGVLKLSAKTGEGMDRWMRWLESALALRLAAD